MGAGFIRTFYAVADRTLWQVRTQGIEGAVAAVTGEVLDICKDKKVPRDEPYRIGEAFHAMFVCVAKSGLVFYNDEHRRLGSPRGEPVYPEELVHPPVARSGSIVGLFLEEEERAARACLHSEFRSTYDQRWEESTVAVLKALVGHKHFVLPKEGRRLFSSQARNRAPRCSLM